MGKTHRTTDSGVSIHLEFSRKNNLILELTVRAT